MYDISVILNAHREGFLASRTIRSLSDAADYAAHFGISIELVIVLDNPDLQTELCFQEADFSAFAAVEVLHVANRSLGLSRNSGCEVAKGKYFSPSDADDLISFNFFVEFFNMAERLGGRDVLLFPKHVIGFGARYFITEYGMDEWMPFLLVDRHPYVSRVFFHRSLFDELHYVDCDAALGHAFEDWHFNAEAIVKGARAHYVDNAILFYRQRVGSIMASSRAAAVNIELEIPDSLLFRPEVYLEKFESAYKSLRSGAHVLPVRHDIKEKFFGSRVLADLTEAANSIDPAIARSKLMEGEAWACMWENLQASAFYYELCEAVHGSSGFSDVFLVPFMPAGGAERYLLDVIQGLIETGLATRILVLSGEAMEVHAWAHRLPAEAIFIDIAKIGCNLIDSQRDRLTVRFIRAAAPDARLHIRSSVFAYRMLSRHFPQLSRRDITFYRFTDGRELQPGVSMKVGGNVEFLTNYIHYITRVITDNEPLVFEDKLLFGPFIERWKVLPALCEVVDTQVAFEGVKRRLLWASRIDGQKRPELAVELAKTIAIVFPGVVLDIYGTVSAGFEIDLSEVSYKGEFSSFTALPVFYYDALVYTSWSDGLPNIVLEAMSVGLPVIAPDVGGIGDVVIDGVTGLLLDVPDEAGAALVTYLSAIQRFYEKPERIAALSLAARELLAARHGRVSYLQNIGYLFGGNNGK